MYNIVKKAIGNSEVGGCQFIINVESLPSFLRDKKCNVCVPFQKKRLEVSQNPKNAQKKIVLLKERKEDGDRKKENDHANVSLIKKLNKKKKKRKEKKEKSVE